MMNRTTLLATLALGSAISYKLLLQRKTRKTPIPHHQERVLIVGASSGVGRSLAKQYASRGAHVCIVARRKADLLSLQQECGTKCFFVEADFSSVQDMLRVRERILTEWNGLDTMHVCAGVSALQPIMALTETNPTNGDAKEIVKRDAQEKGIEKAVEIAGRAIKGNFDGPLITALTFIPLMIRTSTSPSIVLLNTLASVVAAPTRALYAASKSSSLLLYQALSIEHPEISFTFLLPSTIEGDFRASAVDAGPVREADPNRHGLKREYVAGRCMSAVDAGVRGNVILPWWPNALGPHMYAVWPSLVESLARKKYNFP